MTQDDDSNSPLLTFENGRQVIAKFGRVFNNTGVWRGVALILLVVVLVNQFFSINITPKLSLTKNSDSQTSDEQSEEKVDISALRQEVISSKGVVLPVAWGDLGKRMVSDGVIDEQKLRQLFKQGLKEDEEEILAGDWDKPLVLTQQNSRFILDMLWAFGLANKNDILENGEMTDEKYGGDATKFASTGGWSLSRGDSAQYYSKFSYLTLSPEQQALVDEVSRNIYRPCCGNSTHFPDCNHGMAMLGLLELMAANGVSEQEMYKVALGVNAIWFPQTYIDLATYFKEQGTDWKDVDPKLALSSQHSSAKGYQQTRQQIKSLPKPAQGGGGCGV